MFTTGINHLALVCRDMAETVKFYTEILEMPLVKTVQLPDGGQHFFFDCGGGNLLAFFWWEDVTESAPGVASVKKFPGDSKTVVGSMNHVAFSVPEDKLEYYMNRLIEAGVDVLPHVLNHDDSPATISAEMHPGVFVRSVYFTDPNGVMLEFAALTKTLGPSEVKHEPARARALAGAEA